LEDTITGFEKLINGECDDVPEEFFMYKWNINEVLASHKKDTHSKK
jgi:F-type H+-transporting ATPase subunit beta